MGEGIFSSRHARLPLTVVAGLVDQGLGMLDTDTHGKTLRLKRNLLRREHLVDIPCGMAGSKDHLLR